MGTAPGGGAASLDRFVQAQEGVHTRALAELRAGHKASHWMWFVFPQVGGLGLSPMSVRYAIADLAEARAYLAHPVLGPRLAECTQAMLGLPGSDAADVLGGVDALKFRSSMTLFALASPPGSPFEQALAKFFGGRPDARTLELLHA